jgi:hypothetical protein
MARRRSSGFFDFRNFSALQGFADRYRTLAERGSRAEGMAWHSRPPQPCRRKGSPTSMSTVKVVGVSVSFWDRRAEALRRPSAGLYWARVL